VLISTTQAVQLISYYKYPLLFPIAIIEGPIIMVLAGFLFHLGYLEFWPTLLVLVLGDLCGDILWYAVGYFGARRFIERHGKFFGINKAILENIASRFRNHQNKILLVSKVTMGFGFALATLSIAGASRVPIKNFITINLLGGLVWTSVLMLLGYYAGQFYSVIDQKFQIVFIASFCLFIALLVFAFARNMRQRFTKNKL